MIFRDTFKFICRKLEKERNIILYYDYNVDCAEYELLMEQGDIFIRDYVPIEACIQMNEIEFSEYLENKLSDMLIKLQEIGVS